MKRLSLYLLLVIVVAVIVIVLRTRTPAPGDTPIPPPVETLPVAPDMDSLPSDSLYFGEIRAHRARMNAYLRSPQSPLDEEDRAAFTTLRYFPIDPKYRFLMPLREDADPDTVIIMDTKGTERKYVAAGTLEFTVEGTKQELTLFREPSENYWFLPFRDATAGRDTYEVGRYVEPEPAANGHFVVDFNRAYNPYCAYSHRWACPIPPAENVLTVGIPAGEKKYRVEG